MPDEQFVIQRVGVIEIDLNPLGQRQAAEVLIISVVLEKGYPVRADPLEDGLGDSCLSRPGTAGNANDEVGIPFGHELIIPEEVP